jgi:Mrp family chromosome partitioning ATPase/predicted Fe-Mo cluster-binding NifX family protein
MTNNTSSCDSQCGSCSQSQSCSEAPVDFSEKPHDLSQIKKVIGVVSGKGGVGKSLVTSLLAVAMRKLGYKTAILDADVTGPSIPKAFGITEKLSVAESGVFPSKSKSGISVVSINLLLHNDTDPVVWRGPILANTVKQFWKDVIWGDLDFLFVDMPPGTGDVPLTVFQSLPLNGIVVVTSPQELVSMIVGKAVNMANMMRIPILGLVENMSYFECPDNGKKYHLFGESRVEETAKRHKIPLLGRLPIDPRFSKACDHGSIEAVETDALKAATGLLESLLDTPAKSQEESQSPCATLCGLGANPQKEPSLLIALPCKGTQIEEHFGHCENFRIFTVENGTITKEESIPNPGHKPGFLPNFLADRGVKIMIASGMGGGAIDIFEERKVKVVLGATGEARAAVEAYLQGQLESTGSACEHHDHDHDQAHDNGHTPAK